MDLRDMAAIASALASAVSLYWVWRTRRDSKFAQAPIVMFEQPDWRNRPSDLVLHLRSRSNMGYRVESVTAIWPLDARLAVVAFGGHPQGLWGRTVTPDLAVSHQGKEGSGRVMGSGEHHSTPLLFRSARSVSKFSSFLTTVLRRWSVCSDSSHSLRAAFIVRLRDQNAAISVHRRAITLKAMKATPMKAP